MNRFLATHIIIAATFFSVATASADTIYSNEATFLAAVGPVNYENFEQATVTGTPYGSGAQSSIAFSNFTVSATTPSINVFNVVQVGNANVVPVGGSRYLAVNPNYVPHTITLQFPVPINALGFYYRDIDETGAGKMAVGISGGNNFSLAGTGDNGISYFGVVTTVPFSTASIATTVNDSYWTIDGVASRAIPESPTILLVVVAVAALILVRHRVDIGAHV